MEIKDYFIAGLIIILALLAGIVSAYQYIEGSKKDKRDNDNSKKLIEAQEKVLKANDEISAAQKKALDASAELKQSQQSNISKTQELVQAQRKINDLQGEMLKQVNGHGYPKLDIISPVGNDFELFIKPSSGYSIYQLNIVISDATKMKQCPFNSTGKIVIVNKSCYDKSQILSPQNSTDLTGGVMNFIGFKLSKKPYYLTTEFMEDV